MDTRRALKRGRWSTPELARLRRLFPTMHISRLAQLLGRSVESVRVQGHRLFRRGLATGAWTTGEDRVLRCAWGVVAVEDLAVILARPVEAISARAESLRADLRHGPWTAAELAMLRNLYGSRSDEALEVGLQRAAVEIAARASEHRLSKDKSGAQRGPVRMPRWSDREVERLVTMYPERTNLEIARAIGRSVVSVANKASQLGLVKSEVARSRIGAANSALRRRC